MRREAALAAKARARVGRWPVPHAKQAAPSGTFGDLQKRASLAGRPVVANDHDGIRVRHRLFSRGSHNQLKLRGPLSEIRFRGTAR
jgi:hypothetical protein